MAQFLLANVGLGCERMVQEEGKTGFDVDNRSNFNSETGGGVRQLDYRGRRPGLV